LLEIPHIVKFLYLSFKIQLNLYRALKGTWKCTLFKQLPFIKWILYKCRSLHIFLIFRRLCIYHYLYSRQGNLHFFTHLVVSLSYQGRFYNLCHFSSCHCIFFYVVMYALFALSVHVYYVNCNAKTQMGYLCALIKKTKT
jgi:hypothetical protein